MDNFVKITTGDVRQYFEPDENGVFVCTGQEFIASDLCDYWAEDDGGQPIDPQVHQYQPYDMVQPESAQQQEDLLWAAKEIMSDFNRYGEVLQVGDNGEYGRKSAIGRLNTAIQQIDNN